MVEGEHSHLCVGCIACGLVGLNEVAARKLDLGKEKKLGGKRREGRVRSLNKQKLIFVE